MIRSLFATGRLLRYAEPAPDADQAEAATANASFAPEDLIPAGLIFGIAVLAAVALRYGIERVLRGQNEIIARLIARLIAGLVVTIGLFYALSNLGIRVGLLLGAMGIGGFALAFALRDTLENFISGVILQVRQPFDYRDTVEIAGYAGTVTDINLRSVEIKVFSGEMVVLPSKDVLQNPIENWTHYPIRRLDVQFGVSYDVDIDDACRVVTDALTDVLEGVDEPAPDCVFDGFGDSAVNLKARVWFPSDGPYFDVQRDIAARTKRALEAASIDMPYPIRVLVAPHGLNSSSESTSDRPQSGSPTAGPDDGPEPSASNRRTDGPEGDGDTAPEANHEGEGADGGQ